MKIGIIGANGVLGTTLVEIFSKTNTVYSITRENYNSEINKSIIFDYLINANGNSKKYLANQQPLEDFNLSVLSVYKSIFDFKYKHYIQISSIDAENQEKNYGFHKKIAEDIVIKHCPKYNIIRCCAILSKHMKKGVVKDILEGRELFITEDSSLPFITDVAISETLLRLIEDNNLKNNSIYYFTSKNSITVKEIAKIIKSKIIINLNACYENYDQYVLKNKDNIDFKTAEEYIKHIL
jgi:dTDP-4-dehydrorhamnose reductase